MSDRQFDLKDLNNPIIRDFCDQMPGGYFIYKAEGDEELLYANQTVFDLFGCDNEEEFRALTGYTFRGMVHPDDYPDISESIIQQIAEHEKNFDYVEYRITRKDGTVRWIYDYGRYAEDDEYGGLYYVFISDFTKKHMEVEKENKLRSTIINTLTRFYHTVWVIDDIETEHWSLYYADSKDAAEKAQALRKLLKEAPYSIARIPLLEHMVVPEDRDRIEEELSLPRILEQLEDKDQFSVAFLRQYEDGTSPQYFRIDVGKLRLSEKRMGVTMGFMNIDAGYRAVQDAERAMLEAQQAKAENKRLLEQFETVKGLADLVDSVTSLLSNMPAMSFSKNSAGLYIACNQAFATYAHKSTPEEVIGLSDYDLFDAESAKHFIETDQVAFSMDKPYVFFEDVPIGENGEISNLQTTKVKFNDNLGRSCIMGLCIDITEMTRIKTAEAHHHEMEQRLFLQEKLLHEQERREEQDKIITALASDYRSVYHVDLDTNDAVCYRSDLLAVDQHPEGVHFAYYENFANYAARYIDKNYINGFLNFIKAENIRKELSDKSTINYRYLIRRENREYYEMISFANMQSADSGDNSDVSAVVLGLTVVDAEMRDSIAKNEALGQALASAEEANKAKTAFLSNMSHEIRTPMNAIIGLAKLALQDKNVEPKTHEYLEKINGSAHHLLSLINDILDMSRIESGRLVLRKEEFSFRGMLEQINTMMMSQCAEKGLKYECKVIGSVSDYYIGDDIKLKQVLINILGNAVKFTDAPGSVTMTVRCTKVYEDRSTLKFTIKDTGIGIHKDFIPKIFDSFTQENSNRKNKYGSTGLGMAITKNIVELMNGTISVESETGVGSEFTVIVTLKNSEHVGSAPGKIKPRDMRVLVVDDDRVAAENAQLVLEEMGIYVDACYSVEEALRMLRVQYVKHSPYNLVLMDWMMRGKDVLDIVREIRKQYDKETTLIILTAFNWDEIVDEALACGVDGFLAKPLNAASVVNEFTRLARKNNINLMKENRRVDLKGKRILMAEDIFINAEIMKQLMMMKDTLIEHASNGKIALEMFSDSEPGYYDAILMDVRMPEMDGLEATAAIRALDRSDAQRIPIVAMTANAFDEDVQRSLQMGMNAHLSKPVEPEHLYTTLEELIWEAEQT